MITPCKQRSYVMSKGRKTWERAYAAGIIDGEGCIGISRLSRKNYSQWKGKT